MPRQTEPNANNALGALLQGMMHGCSIRSENTQAIVGQAGLQPDIVMTEFQGCHNRRPLDKMAVMVMGTIGKRLRYAHHTAAKNIRLCCRACSDGVQPCLAGEAT